MRSFAHCISLLALLGGCVYGDMTNADECNEGYARADDGQCYSVSNSNSNSNSNSYSSYCEEVLDFVCDCLGPSDCTAVEDYLGNSPSRDDCEYIMNYYEPYC